MFVSVCVFYNSSGLPIALQEESDGVIQEESDGVISCDQGISWSANPADTRWYGMEMSFGRIKETLGKAFHEMENDGHFKVQVEPPSRSLPTYQGAPVNRFWITFILRI